MIKKSQNSKQARFGFRFLDFGFESFGLFRISSFGFWILMVGVPSTLLSQEMLGAINLVEVVLLNIKTPKEISQP